MTLIITHGSGFVHLIKTEFAAIIINYGENPGGSITSSGTIGAALKVAAAGTPALAISLETAPEFHYSHSLEVDFEAAAHLAHFFARRLLLPDSGFPLTPVNPIDVPRDATPGTP